VGAGAVMTEVPQRCFPKPKDAERLRERFPQVLITKSELHDIRHILEPGAQPPSSPAGLTEFAP
jgi:hypothetical protein